MENLQSYPIMKPRIQSIDLLRGIVMIVMALDHTRDFIHYYALAGFDPLNFTTTSAPIFLSRWITHFCAPIFIYLSGTSVFFMSERKTSTQISFFLFTRGLWLVILEFTILQSAWGNFSLQFTSVGVIALLGICMIILSVLIYLPQKILLPIGLLLVFGHNLLDNFDTVTSGVPGFIWSLLHVPHQFKIDDNHILEVLYCVIPWLGVMISGYVFGSLYNKNFDPFRRKKILIRLGTACVVLFILLRSGNFYGDQHHWDKQSSAIFTILFFIDTSKYPPSLLYLLMTIGPGMIFLGYAEKMKGQFLNAITIFGRVPLFYYVLHIFLIYAIAWFVFYLQGYSMYHVDIRNSHTVPQGVGLPLFMVYFIWMAVIVILYFPCRRYNRYKSTHSYWWLSYM